MRATGASRAQAAFATGLAGAVPVIAGTVLAVAGAVVVSPLAPVARSGSSTRPAARRHRREDPATTLGLTAA
ncbi:MAG TPA: hypothetical protein VKD66_18130 [Streptosporangiaceae bacterium]|nr:hypothetical protein [Streptosporangiaceae bacterium]